MKILRKEFLSDDAMAGAFAGAFARLISAPFDVCDNLSVVIVYVHYKYLNCSVLSLDHTILKKAIPSN